MRATQVFTRLAFTSFALTGLMPLVLQAQPAAAATAAQKMETCKYGAEHDNLTGAKRDAFIKKCMTNANYEPSARKDALKKKPASAAKPAAAAAAAPAAAEEETDEKPQ